MLKAGGTIGARRGTPKRVRQEQPDPIPLTEFRLIDLANGEELGRKKFSANRANCTKEAFPDSVESSGWVGGLIAAHKR